MLCESVHQLDCQCLYCAVEEELQEAIPDKETLKKAIAVIQDLQFLKDAQDNDIEIP